MNQEQLTIEAISGQGELYTASEKALAIIEKGPNERIQKHIKENLRTFAEGDLRYSAKQFARSFIYHCRNRFFFTREKIANLSEADMYDLDSMIYETQEKSFKRNKIIMYCLLPTVIGGLLAYLHAYDCYESSSYGYLSERSYLQKMCGEYWLPSDIIRNIALTETC